MKEKTSCGRFKINYHRRFCYVWKKGILKQQSKLIKTGELAYEKR